MSESLLRPRYKLTSNEKASVLRGKLLRVLNSKAQNPMGLEQKSVANHLIVSLPRKVRHFWSPTLDINLEESAPGQTTVRILIGPEPAVWTMFMFGYSIAGLLVISGLVLGYSQFILDQNSWTFVFAPIGLLFAGALFLAALAGKYKAQTEMRKLMQFVEQALEQDLFPQERKEAGAMNNPG